MVNAQGKILSNDITSNINVPQYNNSAVDGYAIKFADLKKSNNLLGLIGKNPPSKTFQKSIPPLSTLQVFTGSPVPLYFDTVVMHEDCKINEFKISFPKNIKLGQNLRKKGEDILKNKIILNKGKLLRPEDIGQLAAIGVKKIKTFKPLKVTIFSTGNELQELGGKNNIKKRYDSNRYILLSFLKELNCEIVDLGIIKDEFTLIKETINLSLSNTDLIISSGGASVGEEDYIYNAIKELGTIHISRIKIKPGKPLLIGEVKKSIFVGLPGNTSAMFTVFLRIIKPLILLMSGAKRYLPNYYLVESGFTFKKKLNRTEFLKVKLSSVDGKVIAMQHPHQATGIFHSFVESDGLVELDENINYIKKGMLIKFFPFNER